VRLPLVPVSIYAESNVIDSGESRLSLSSLAGRRSRRTTILRMAMGKRKRDRQPSMWVATADFPTAASHPFYTRLNHLLRERGFDGFVEAQCAMFYAETMGRPSLPPGIYFRLLLIGYFEGIDSERGIAGALRTRSRCATSWASVWKARRPTTRRFRARVG
jgi:Transposase domain (DUF772)